MISNQCKYNHHQFSGYCHQSLHWRHSFSQMPLIRGVENTIFTSRIKGAKKQQLSQQCPASFRDTTASLMFSRADLVKIQSRQFHYFRNGLKLSKIANLSYQTGSRYMFDTLDRQYRMAVRNLLQEYNHLFFQIFDMSVLIFDIRNKVSYLQKYALYAFRNTYRLYRSIIKFFSPISTDLSPTDLFDNLIKLLNTYGYNAFRVRKILNQIHAGLCRWFYNTYKLWEYNKDKILKLIIHGCPTFYRSLSCMGNTNPTG